MRAEKTTLADQLEELAHNEDGGAPKTGRRYYYLALSYGYIKPDMGASDAAKAERNAAYKRVTDVLGVMRMSGQLGWHMVLDLTRELDEWQTYSSPREARARMRRGLRRGSLARSTLLSDPYRREGHHGAGVQANGDRMADAVRVVAWLQLP